MTGKELKAFAATVHDDAIISVKEKGGYRYEELFRIKAYLSMEIESTEELSTEE